MTTWEIIAKATGDGYECVLTLSEIPEEPTTESLERAKAGCASTFHHFFKEEAQTVAATYCRETG